MIFLLFFLAAFLLTAFHAVCTGLSIAGLILVFLAGYLLANLCFVLYYYFLGCFVDTSKPIEKKSRLCQNGVTRICQFICGYANIHTTIHQQELLPTEGRFVLVSNHRSAFDPLTLGSKLGRYEIAYVSKPENLKIPVVKTIGYGAGILPIDRENDRNALRTILQAAEYIKKDFCSIAIYPEGTRSKTDELLPFHAGSFKIAQKAGVPLVIASTEGTENLHANFPWRRTKVDITILEVIPAEQVKAMSTKEMAEYARSLIGSKLQQEKEKPSEVPAETAPQEAAAAEPEQKGSGDNK